MFGTKKEEIIVDEKKIENFLSRGVENIFPNRDFLKSQLLKGKKLTMYLGIDPTGPTLHLGHVIILQKMAEFQKLGHQIILLMGDFTAMIGDPTDKMAARKQLTHDEVMDNLKLYKEQASKYISFSGSNKAEIKFNSEWLEKMNFKDVLNLTSKMTVDQMLKRDMFVKRAEEGKPIYIHEFMYPLMQGYDSVAMDVDGEIGGNDQTFNMLTGRDLMKEMKNKEKFVIAMKLLVDANGKKMGKTENNLVSLNQSPEDMFGKVMSWSDGLIITGFELITCVSSEEINEMNNQINSGVNPKDIKMKLAFEIVKMYHGEKAAEQAQDAFDNTFAKGAIPEDVVEVSVAQGTPLVEILLVEKVIVSKSEWRRLVSEGAVTLMDTDTKITNPDAKAESGVYKVGKRRFLKIKIL